MRIKIKLHADGDSGLNNCTFVLMYNHPVETRGPIGERIFEWTAGSRYAAIMTLEELATALRELPKEVQKRLEWEINELKKQQGDEIFSEKDSVAIDNGKIK